ncbi:MULTISPECIES: helix-turn-helix domain-containing protein [unclassified Iodidimonas]|uniref:helix-turn-helix domain-containing protein n=1 Tax=unclassified Iodidimonas TaxID=2626145 RepID=UPI00248326A7|nr:MULTISPECIES: helix-turn-helix domain-containing protein [unclassified Iodidimonas]
MGKLTGKIIEAQAIEDGLGTARIGAELKKLRILAGLTQGHVAASMDVQQASISKIENGGEIYLSTVERYVKALGASLRLNAHFPVDTPIAARLQSVPFDIEPGHDDQLILPILADEPFKPQRDVVLSIKPVYSEKILTGEKTVELRRRFPVAAPHGALAYIYSSSPVKAMVGTASIRDVLKLPVEQIWNKFESKAFIERPLFDKYFEGLDYGYALVFDDVKSFTRPLPLHELREKFGFEPPQSFLYAKHDLRRALQDEPSSVSH